MIKNLIFEGGGVLGAAYGGALQELDERNIYRNIEKTAGTSAGAITATLVALKYTPKEITDIICNADFHSFVNDGILSELWFFFNKGLHTGKNFVIWMELLIHNKTGIKNITFRQLHDSGGYRDLYIVGSNLTYGIEEIYSYENSPDMVISEAVRTSMSIPFYFDYVEKKCTTCGQKSKYKCNSISKCILVDGGLYWNYPVGIFDNGDNINTETLGFRLGKEEKRFYQEGMTELSPSKIDTFKDYLFMVIGILINNNSRLHLKEKDFGRTVFIDTNTISALDFSLSDKNKRLLIENGRNGVKEFFQRSGI